jgi:DNA-binding transcriptional LysR family regulator
LPKLLARYPEMTVELALVDRFVDLADEGFDIVLRLTDDPPQAAVARRLLAVEFVLCASPGYLRRCGAPTQISDLAKHNCIRQGHPVAVSEWKFTDKKRSERVTVQGNAVLTGSEPIRTLLLAGVGCGILPDFLVADDLRKKKLVRLLPEWRTSAAFSSLYALYLPTRQGNPKVRAFIDFLLETLPQDSV